jgi:hypothetical protein
LGMPLGMPQLQLLTCCSTFGWLNKWVDNVAYARWWSFGSFWKKASVIAVVHQWKICATYFTAPK